MKIIYRHFFLYRFFYKIIEIIKSFFRKYVEWNGYWNSEKLYKFNEKKNRNFKWSEENIKKIKEINDYLTLLMEEVYIDCLNLRNKFDVWIKDGKDFYKGYEIKGYIYIDEYEEGCGTRKKNFIEAKDYITDYETWSVRFSDSSFCRTEIKKERQMKGCWDFDSNFVKMLKEKGIEKPCAFLEEIFGRDDSGYSLDDAVRMDKKNLCKCVEVNFA